MSPVKDRTALRGMVIANFYQIGFCRGKFIASFVKKSRTSRLSLSPNCKVNRQSYRFLFSFSPSAAPIQGNFIYRNLLTMPYAYPILGNRIVVLVIERGEVFL